MDFADKIKAKQAAREERVAETERADAAKSKVDLQTLAPYADALRSAAAAMATDPQFRQVFGSAPPQVQVTSQGEAHLSWLDCGDLSKSSARGAKVTLRTGGADYTQQECVLFVGLTAGDVPGTVDAEVILLEDLHSSWPYTDRNYRAAVEKDFQVTSAPDLIALLQDSVADMVAERAIAARPEAEPEPEPEKPGLLARFFGRS